MQLCCLDLEGVLLPEMWLKVAGKFRVKELRLTTRDISDYDQLMRHRIRILRKEGIRLADIQRTLNTVRPLPGARRFLDALRAACPVIILSDTFYEFARPLMRQLGEPALFCNRLTVSRSGYIDGYVLRQRDGKRKAVKALKQTGFRVKAAGDSYNDLTMLRTADEGVLFNPPESIAKRFTQYPVARDYQTLLKLLLSERASR